MLFEEIVEKWSGKSPDIFLLCYELRMNMFIQRFSGAKIKASIIEENQDHNLIMEKLNNNPVFDTVKFDLIVVDGKIPELDAALVRRTFHLLHPEGIAVVLGEKFDDCRFLQRFENVEYDWKNRMTVFVKPKESNIELDLKNLDNVFLADNTGILSGKDFVIITSTIFCEGRNFSVFYPEERFEQTLKTISSVREKIPSAKIILVEMSKLTQEYVSILSKLCDMVITFQTEPYQNKHAGELILLSQGFRALPKEAEHVYKISARAYLTDDFRIEKFRGNKPTFSMDGERRLNTKFYHVPFAYIGDFRIRFLEWIQFLEYNPFPCVEKLFYSRLTDIEIVDKLGVNMLVSSTGALSQS